MGILDRFSSPPNIVELEAKEDVKALIKVLRKARDSFYRSMAASALGNIGDAKAIEPLILAMQDEEVNVRTSAAESLGKIGDSRVISPLIGALESDNRSLRWKAANSLTSIGDKGAVEPLVSLLKSKDREIRLLSAKVLGDIGNIAAVEPLNHALTDIEPSVRWNIAEALGKISDSHSVEFLVPALNDEDCQVRWEAAIALRKMGWHPSDDATEISFYIATRGQYPEEFDIDRLGKDLVRPLIASLKDGYKDVRVFAARKLARIGDACAIEYITAARNAARDSWEEKDMEEALRNFNKEC